MREAQHRTEQAEEKAALRAAGRPDRAPTPHRLVGLQRAVGNHVVTRLVDGRPIVARNQVPPVPLEEAEQARVAPADRHALETAATGYIPLAFTAFSNATQAHAAAIKNAAKAEAETIALVIDVLTGFAAPLFANYVVSKLTAKAVQSGMEAATKQAVITLISKQDAMKAAFTGATKVANQLMKNASNTLFGETEIDAFALALRNTFQRGAAQVLNRLTTLTDAELIAVWTAYDPDNADETAYRHVLGDIFARYQKQVAPIGTGSGPSLEGGPTVDSRVYEVQLATRKRLATLSVWSSGEHNLWAWITPDMDAIARAKSQALGLGIPTIGLRDVGMTLAEILDPPRPDLRRKDMLEVARALGAAELRRAAADPDVVTIVETAREHDYRIPSQAERKQTLFVLAGYSDHVIACVEELDSWFPSGAVVDRHLQATDAGERARVAKEQWFVERVRAKLSGYQLERVLFTLGLGPAPTPSAPKPTPGMPPPGHPWW